MFQRLSKQKMKNLFSIFLVVISIQVFCQSEVCNFTSFDESSIQSVDKNDILCLARNSSQPSTLIYTFGIWCAPCRAHIKNAIKLSENYDTELFVLLIEKEQSSFTERAIQFLREQKKDIKIIILKDSVYGKNRRSKNKKFLTEITPSQFENIDDMSKYILIDKTGKVLMVTNYKDMEGDDWKDDTGMIKRRIVPLLNNPVTIPN